MSEQWQTRRDTWAVISASTPAVGEMWYITDLYSVVIGDGSTQGGIPVGFTTGDVKVTGKGTVEAGWLLYDGRTLGDTGSGATLAGSEYQALFEHIWDNFSDTECPVSTGRGGSASADWSAGKTITMVDVQGRAIIGAGTGSGLTARTVGEEIGEEDHTLTKSEMPLHGHAYQQFATHENQPNNTGAGPFMGHDAGGGTTYSEYTGAPSGTDGQAIGGTGGGGAHNNVQPSMPFYVWVKM